MQLRHTFAGGRSHMRPIYAVATRNVAGALAALVVGGPIAHRAPGDPVVVSARLWEWKRSEEHTSELQSLRHLVCRLLLEKKKKKHTKVQRVPRRKPSEKGDECKPATADQSPRPRRKCVVTNTRQPTRLQWLCGHAVTAHD